MLQKDHANHLLYGVCIMYYIKTLNGVQIFEISMYTQSHRIISAKSFAGNFLFAFEYKIFSVLYRNSSLSHPLFDKMLLHLLSRTIAVIVPTGEKSNAKQKSLCNKLKLCVHKQFAIVDREKKNDNGNMIVASNVYAINSPVYRLSEIKERK